MKRIFSLFLFFVLLSSLLIIPSYAAEDEVTAVPTDAYVVVNDKYMRFDAYNIEGNNFFKLRDIAFALSGTDKGFNVKWNGNLDRIELIPETTYTPVGGEMELKLQVPASIQANKTSSSIFLNGEEVSLTAYNINDNNFFKLRDIAVLFNLGVSWDGLSRTIYLDSFKQKEVTVSTAEEFVRAIASNTVIRLKPGIYDLTIYDIRIYDVSNLSIIGAGADKTELINANRYREILEFEYCRNIMVSGVKAGHTPQEYECDAGVFNFYGCVDVDVSDCYLYGCGSTGVRLYSCTAVSVNNTTITDCSFHAVLVYDSVNVVFNNCKLIKNPCFASVIAVSSYYTHTDVTFNKCDISDNYNIGWSLVETYEYDDGYVSLTFNDCTAENNVGQM